MDAAERLLLSDLTVRHEFTVALLSCHSSVQERPTPLLRSPAQQKTHNGDHKPDDKARIATQLSNAQSGTHIVNGYASLRSWSHRGKLSYSVQLDQLGSLISSIRSACLSVLPWPPKKHLPFTIDLLVQPLKYISIYLLELPLRLERYATAHHYQVW